MRSTLPSSCFSLGELSLKRFIEPSLAHSHELYKDEFCLELCQNATSSQALGHWSSTRVIRHPGDIWQCQHKTLDAITGEVVLSIVG